MFKILKDNNSYLKTIKMQLHGHLCFFINYYLNKQHVYKIGDLLYQPHVISDPQLKHIDLDGTEDYFIIGCDGLWEGLDQQKLLELVYDNRNESGVNMAELLVRKSLENGSMDNITAVFVLLRESLSQIEKPQLTS